MVLILKRVLGIIISVYLSLSFFYIFTYKTPFIKSFPVVKQINSNFSAYTPKNLFKKIKKEVL
jgi:hypothetical protein